jgi:hypothetical protein
MPVRLLRGYFLLRDGTVGDDFEALPTGAIAVIPTVTGTAGCVLGEGTFVPRI